MSQANKIAQRLWRRGWSTALTCALSSGLACPLVAQQSTTFSVNLGSQASSGNMQDASVEIQLKRLKNTTSAPVVTALAASHEGRFLAAAGDDHAIRIIDVASGQTVQTVLGHIDWIQSMFFAYESVNEAGEAIAPVLYSSGNDGRVLEWRYEYPVDFREIIRVPYAVRSISVSSDHQLLAIGGFADEILLWDLQEDLLKHRLACDCSDQHCVRFSPDGKRILCGSRDGGIKVWDTQSGEVISDYHQHASRVATAAFSKDGNTVTSAGEDRAVVRFDLRSQSVVRKRELAMSKMMSMCMLNESVVAVAGADSKIRLYDVDSDTIVSELEGHLGTVAVMVPCGDRLASGSFDTTVRIWDLQKLSMPAGNNGKPVVHAPLNFDDDLRIR